MAGDERLALIRKIEKERGSKVISYITADRAGLYHVSGMEYEDVRVIERHLRALFKKNVKKLDLFIYTPGGDAVAPLRLVSLIREFLGPKGEFSVLVPNQAMSAGTMTALGADEIVMARAGHIGPIDVQTYGIGRYESSVESLRAYFDLARSVGLTSRKARRALFLNLSKQVPPITLGRMQQTILESERGAMRLLDSRRKPLSRRQNKKIIRFLIRDIGFHGQSIRRTEAKQAGLKFVSHAEQYNIEQTLETLYDTYEDIMDIDVPFARSLSDSRGDFFQPGDHNDISPTGDFAMEQPIAIIESTERLDIAKAAYMERYWRDAPAVPGEIKEAVEDAVSPSATNAASAPSFAAPPVRWETRRYNAKKIAAE